jgi:hypothetical protein
MNLIEEIKELPRKEKLIVMETIWNDLSSDENFDSPNWHKGELLKTESRLNEGQEDILEWNSAKQSLRKEFE